jgi:hypothetical protein
VENVVEVRYAGVGIGRSTALRDWNEGGAFIGFAEPMPTGTPLVLKGDGIDQAARVVETIESVDLSVAGMRVVFVSGAEPARPAPKPATATAAMGDAPAEASPVEKSPVKASPAEASPGADDGPVEAAPPSSGDEPPVGDADTSGVTEAQHPNDGEAGSNAGSGKRRRRRK